MKNKVLIKKLQELDHEAQIICGVHNGQADTYALADHIFEAPFEDLFNDLFGTPGQIDNRLLRKRLKNIIYIGSTFK